LAVTGNATFSSSIISNALLDVNEDIDVDFDANDEEVNITSSATDYVADSAMVTLFNSGAGQTNNHYLLT